MNFIQRKQKTISELIKGNKILDMGFAQYPNDFLSGKKEIIGVDIQKVKRPSNYKKVFRLNLNMQELPFEDKYFDTVIAGEVMEHVENPSFVLREINRVLKPNGKFIVTIPNANYYWETIRNWFFTSIPSWDIGEHLSNWTILDFKRLLKKNGFNVVKLYGTNIVLPHNILFIPSKPFPKLSWIIVYDCIKEKEPIWDVITRKPLGNYETKPTRITNILYDDKLGK